MASMLNGNGFFGEPLWQNGPNPGSFYDFPSINAQATNITKHTLSPATTGTSVLGIKFDGGVAICADTLGSYGSMARYRNCQRVMKVNDNIILGADGDYADFQFLKTVIEEKVIKEECQDDDFSLKPKSLHCWLTRVMYNRRSKFDPLWNTYLIGGLENGEPFLGFVDKIGTAFESPHIATGYGSYIALPMMRDAYEKNPKMTEEQAKKLLTDCMRVLFYRDARSFYKFEIAIVTKAATKIEGPLVLDTDWSFGVNAGCEN